MLAEGDGAGGDNERGSSAPGGVLNHGTYAQDGPVTREALTVPEEVRFQRGAGKDPPRRVRQRVHAPSAKKSARPQVGRRRGTTGAEAEDVRTGTETETETETGTGTKVSQFHGH